MKLKLFLAAIALNGSYLYAQGTSYQMSCKGCVYKDNKLSCTCNYSDRKGDVHTKQTELALNKLANGDLGDARGVCTDISNKGGKLVCNH